MIALQTDIGLAIEHRAAVLELTIVQVEVALQREDRMQAAAEVLITAQAEIRIRHYAAAFLPGAVATLIVGINQAGIQRTVQRDTALSVSGHGEQTHDSRDN